jgi:4-hydroxy-3-methylbut-2-enyl diphosphate reductase
VPVEKVLLAEPRGFCAGVEMAIKALAWMVRVFEPPVYCYHEIVHNRLVVERFRDLGVVFVDDISEVPQGAPLMLSAHGSAPEVVAAAKEHGGTVVDAVCPLVTKVHHEAKVRANKGFTILYVGHDGHDEAMGTIAVAPDAMRLVEGARQLDAITGDLDETTPVAVLAQTTLAHNEWSEVLDQARARYPNVWTASRNDLCFATTNRQTALQEIAQRADAVVVIGSANSSNTLALAKVAKVAGSPIVLRVDDPSEIDAAHLADARVVGVTAGASAPDELVSSVIAALNPRDGVELVRVTDEDEYFPPPRELRDALGALGLVTAILVGADASIAGDGGPFADDRTVSASDVLASLAR